MSAYPKDMVRGEWELAVKAAPDQREGNTKSKRKALRKILY